MKQAEPKQVEMELPLFHEAKGSDNVQWLVSFLEGKDWITASEICGQVGWEATENNKRKLRAWADASEGKIIGHQKGYKLTTSMTLEEYTWWRNETLKARESIEGRVIESDKVFYGKKAVKA